MTIIECSKCKDSPAGRFATRCARCGTTLTFSWKGEIDPARIDTAKPFGERLGNILPAEACRFCREPEALRSRLIDASDLGREYGMTNLLLKDETRLPTGTTKARMAAAALAYLAGRGVRQFVVVSTGNNHSAMTRLMPRYPELEMIAFAGLSFAERCRYTDAKNVRLVIHDGDFVGAERAAKEYAQAIGATWEGGFFNPARRLGLATAYLEVYAELGRHPDWYVQAISSGMGLVGTGELAVGLPSAGGGRRIPRLLGVQQDTCAPIVRAFEEGVDDIQEHHRVTNPTGVAKAILRGDPSASYPIVRGWVIDSGGDLVAVSRDEILDSLEVLNNRYNIPATADGAAALAGSLRWAREGGFLPDQTVLVNISG